MNAFGLRALLLIITMGVGSMAVTGVIIILAPDLIAPFYRVFAPRSYFGIQIGDAVNPGIWLTAMAGAIISVPIGGALAVFVARN